MQPQLIFTSSCLLPCCYHTLKGMYVYTYVWDLNKCSPIRIIDVRMYHTLLTYVRMYIRTYVRTMNVYVHMYV